MRERERGRDKESFLRDQFAFICYFTSRRYNFASHIKGTLHQYRLIERARVKEKWDSQSLSIDRARSMYKIHLYTVYIRYRHMYI